MTKQKITPEDFRLAFAMVWSKIYREQREQINKKYGNNGDWTKFLLTSFDQSTSDLWGGLFAQTAKELQAKRFGIEHIRREDYKIDMMVVGGQSIEPWKKGNENHWGYATRCMVMIEHENQMEACHEELYNLMVRRGELKVLAFPQWKKDADSSGIRGGGISRTATQALDETLLVLRRIYDAMKADENLPGENDNLLLLVSQWADGEIQWSYSIGVPSDATGLSKIDA